MDNIQVLRLQPDTAGHQKKVTELAFAISSEMGLSEDQIDGIRIAGLLHDIGKISVPTSILNRSGHLNEHEFNLIKMHSQTGFDIVKDIEFDPAGRSDYTATS